MTGKQEFEPISSLGERMQHAGAHGAQALKFVLGAPWVTGMRAIQAHFLRELMRALWRLMPLDVFVEKMGPRVELIVLWL